MLASWIFLNPFTMMIGAALIASPIIIHLINRMRFKRIRWAAMEFLLKAQKRSRRRMIIEQLILLLLRILLVALIALLLSRLIEKQDEVPPEALQENKGPPIVTLHVIVLDDSASMSDHFWQVDNQGTRTELIPSARAAETINKQIVGSVKDDNRNPHNFIIVPISNPKKFIDFDRLTTAKVKDIEDFLANDYKIQPLHFGYEGALQQAEEFFKAGRDLNLVLHVVSDFRTSDWNEATKDSLGKIFERYELAKVQVKMHDVASPKRDPEKALTMSNNLAIVDFRPESPIALKNVPHEFTVTVANYSNVDQTDVLVRVKVNGVEKRDGSVTIDLIKANDTYTQRVVFSLDRIAPKGAARDKDETSRFDGFNLVTAQLKNQTTGLELDDIRYTVVEVRESMSMLLVDEQAAEHRTINSESFYIWNTFSKNYRGFDVQIVTSAQMEKMNLQPFSAVILCNVPRLTPVGVRKLEAYLGNGGGVAFFMGLNIDPKFYNESLWKNGQGMFPVPLGDIANKTLTRPQLIDVQKKQRSELYRKLVVRADMRRHPAMEKLYTESRIAKELDLKYENSFFGVSFARHYTVDRPKFNPGDDVQTLIYLPNYRSIADFEPQMRALLKKLREATEPEVAREALNKRLAETMDENAKQIIRQRLASLDLEKFAKYKSTIDRYTGFISNTVGNYQNPLYNLVLDLEILLFEKANTDPASPRASMIEFWQESEVVELKKEFLQFLDTIKFGDPFYVAKQYKRGRSLVFLGSAGTSGDESGLWNPLNDELGGNYFPLLMKESLQRYLCATSSELSMNLGNVFDFNLEPGLNEPLVHPWHVDLDIKPEPLSDEVRFRDLGSTTIDTPDKSLTWKFDNGDKPGVYLFDFALQAPMGTKKDSRLDLRAVTYNFDTQIESNLERARTEELTKIARVEKIESIDDIAQTKKVAKQTKVELPTDEKDLGFSKSPWLYLGLLIILILEQMWAVRLSHHARAGSSNLNLPRPLSRGPVVA